jgi:hypothetical protein
MSALARAFDTFVIEPVNDYNIVLPAGRFIVEKECPIAHP